MVNCTKCSLKIGFFETKYNYEDEQGNTIKYCSKCNEKYEMQQDQEEYKETTQLDSGIENRFEYLIRKFRNEEKDMELPTDPKKYDDNCWVCFDGGARWYKGFRKLCSDCVEVLESKDNIKERVSNINKIKKEKREFLIKEEKRIKKESIDREIRIKKEQEEKQILKEKNAPLVSDLCRKYLSTKDFDFKNIIWFIYKNKEIFGLIEEEDLDYLQGHFRKFYQQSQENSPSSSEEYDEVMSLETIYKNGCTLIKDVIKLGKLFEKKDIKTNYIQIFEEMAKIVEQDIKNLIQKLTIPAYKRISKITTTDKKRIVMEYLKLGFDEPNEMIISDLFDKFGLKATNEEIISLLKKCIEENELEDFENNLGLKKTKNIEDFNNLNGHQFEDYLKKLFSILGYQVIRTKLSGDQGADLIIKKDNNKTVVQAKKYSGDVTNKAIQEVVASIKYYGAEKAIVVTTGTFTKSAMDLAKSNGVELWDKDKLQEIINKINKQKN